MAGRCGCASAPSVGAAAVGSGCVSISGAGTPASPFSIGLSSACLPLIPCTSGTRPGSPATGQPIYESDTGRTLVWSGSAWRPTASNVNVGYRKQAASTQTLINPGTTTIASLTIPDPGWPYMIWASANFYAEGGSPDDSWNISLSEGTGVFTSIIEAVVRPCGAASFNRAGATTTPDVMVNVSGAVTLNLTATPACVSATPLVTKINTGRNRIAAIVIPE